MADTDRDLAVAELLKRLKVAHKDGADRVLREWREQHPRKVDLRGVTFERINLKNARFTDLDLYGAQFVDCTLSGANFQNCNLGKCKFLLSNPSDGDYKYAALQCVFDHCNAQDARFDIRDMTACKFNQAKLQGARFSSDLSGSRFNAAQLERADFTGSDLRDVDFRKATLVSAVLCECTTDEKTQLAGAETTDCTIDRVGLMSLGSGQGGLTTANLHAMVIHDEQATLRLQFHGLAKAAYFSALVVFLGPYAWFVFEQAMRARFVESGEDKTTLSLFTATARYVWNGGNGWQEGWRFHWSFLLFIGFGLYNLCRLFLLRKAVMLEAQEAVTGIPPRFDLQPISSAPWYYPVRYLGWGFWMKLVWWFTWGAYLMAVINTLYFMSMRVPLG